MMRLFDILCNGKEIAYVWATDIGAAYDTAIRQWPKYRQMYIAARSSVNEYGHAILQD